MREQCNNNERWNNRKTMIERQNYKKIEQWKWKDRQNNGTTERLWINRQINMEQWYDQTDRQTDRLG